MGEGERGKEVMAAWVRSAVLGLLCLLQGLALSAPGSAAGDRIALVIGNASYKETAQLKNTLHDAADVAAALKRLGFVVLDGMDLDKRAMERLIREFDKKLAGAEVALFFYAGHGLQVAGQNYLVPTDARLAAEGDVDFESIPLHLVLSRMEREARTSLVLLDACRDNPLARNLARTMGTRSTGVGQGLAEVRTGVGTLISFSTQPGNVALDGDSRNSPYTGALLQHMEVPGRDVLGALAAVRGEVVRATGGKQVPWEHTSLLGPVVLNPGTGVSAQATPPMTGEASSIPAAERHWDKVQHSISVRELEAFARRYAGTFHADLAQARIDDLKAKVATASPPADARTRPPSPHNRTEGHAPAPSLAECAKHRAPDGGLYCASSILAPQHGNSYGPANLYDGSPATAWVHGGRSAGIGASITITFSQRRTVKGITLINGYAKNADIFAKNSRVRRLDLVFSGGETHSLALPDDRQRRSIRLSSNVEAEWVQLRIAEVYPGSKYVDTAISELQID